MGWIAAEPAASGPKGAPSANTNTNTKNPAQSQPTQKAPAPPASRAQADAARRGPDLEGRWKSDSGRMYDVVWTNGAYEFRIRDTSQFPEQNYANGEPRFLLRPIPDELETYFVEDRIRPFPPEGTKYDPIKSKESCVEVWTEIENRPLRAQIDGERLWVRMVRLEPDASMFQREGPNVVGCKGIREAPASEVDSFLTRQK
jgi:hypothetical protein